MGKLKSALLLTLKTFLPQNFPWKIKWTLTMYKFKKIKASNGLGNGFETSGKNKKKGAL